jgi:hypothetical protein
MSDSEILRAVAKYATRCPRCKQPIKIDSVIVKSADSSAPWCHATCPRDMLRYEKPSAKSYTMKVVDGVVIQELEQ